MYILLNLLVCSIFVVSDNEAARILAVFPTPSISHQVVFRPLTQELAKRGHEVTVITPDPVFKNSKAPPNLTEIDVHDISYNIWMESFMKSASKGNKNDMLSQIEIFLSTFPKVFNAQVQSEEVQTILSDKKRKFDLIFIEACVRSSLALSHVYKGVPVIVASSLGSIPGNYEVIGASEHPLLYASIFQQRIYDLSILEKITELYNLYQIKRAFKNNVEFENRLLQQAFGPDIPSVEELSNNVDMLFLNINPIFEGIRPVPPSVVYMGGLHLQPSKELPTDIKKYLDLSKHGVIYFSFGTNVAPSTLPPERIAIFTKVFSKLPYDVLWKWDKDDLPGRSDNIRISKWLPQSDLLRHPKVKLFITQGGLQSTDEAIVAGVPLIGFPLLADQWFNVEKYVHFKIGIKLDLATVTEEKLFDAIKSTIEDVSYRQNLEKLRSIMFDTPQTPLERAVWWTEYVLRHGGAKHLRSPAANISWAEYLELELVLTLLTGLFAILAVFIASIYLLYKKFISRGNSKQKRS
ncbi:unnamed protein product [Chrysodeixis includens]|uniref:UDP-glucuronosyltransferase n=1 Tax=Chrysodeixis includens TaxID=689277 RepID=A0A9P0BYB4_CHRIL|nr:unnamed protein product [Chrysodeixis includens]